MKKVRQEDGSQNKKNGSQNRAGKHMALLTVAVAFLLVAGAVLLLTSTFQRLKSADSNYTPVEAREEDAGGEIPSAENQAENINDLEEQPDNEETLSSNLQQIREETGQEQPDHLEALRMQDRIDQEFDVEDAHFYTLKGGLTPAEDEISAEEAATRALEALKEYFPGASWKETFAVALVYSSDTALNTYGLSGLSPTLWNISMIDDDMLAYVIIHPKTGNIGYVSYRERKSAGAVRSDESYDTPCLSLKDFYYLSDDSTWITNGMNLIRSMGLNGEEEIIRYDEETGIYHGAGYVYAEYLIGDVDSGNRVGVTMKLLTQDFTGYISYSDLQK